MESPTSKTILLIEDNESLNHAVVFKIKQYGHNVISTTNAEEALEVLKQNNHIDIIWLDILLPRMNGLEFLKKIRGQGVDKKVVICAVSDNEDYKEKARELGVTDYLTKSAYDLDELVTKVLSYA